MDPTLALLAGAGGTALVQAMMSDAWAGVRDAAARLLGRGDAEHESSTLTLLDASRRSVRQATPGSEESVHATQSALWAARFAVVLENEPERAVLLNALLSLAAAERRGLGIGVELAAAVALGTPVIVVAPRNSKYRLDELNYRGVTVTDYIHPHVASLASYVVESFSEAGQTLVKTVGEKSPPTRRPQWLDPAIKEYCDNMLRHDPPMLAAQELLGLTK